MGRACGMWHVWKRREILVHTGFGCGNLKERDDLEYIDTDGSIILKWILKIGLENLDWIDLA
jgi:hypothetical protein